MRIFKILLGALVALVAVVLGLGLVLPSDFRVVRSVEIEAPPEVVFGQVNSLKSWGPWSPWMAKDKTIKNEYSGPEAGKGAKVSWTSEASGEGTQEIIESKPFELIETKLDFGDQGTSKADWKFEPTDKGVKVTWGLEGDLPAPLGGIIATRMDAWVGADYEDGLARLKKHAEALPPPPKPEPAPEPEAPNAEGEPAAEGTEAPAPEDQQPAAQ